MKCLVIIRAGLRQEQLEFLHYQMLSLLNFDHDLEVVFMPGAESLIHKNPQILKNWAALSLYGVENFFLCAAPVSKHDLPFISTVIEETELTSLMANKDLIL